MKTVLTILVLQMFLGVSASANSTDASSTASNTETGVQTSGASGQTAAFNEDREEARSRVDKFLASLEEGGAGGGSASRSRGPRPSGNSFGEKGPANR